MKFHCARLLSSVVLVAMWGKSLPKIRSTELNFIDTVLVCRFGADVMENVATWTKNLCLEISQRHLTHHVDNTNCLPAGEPEKDLSGWSVLDVGTGNGLLLQELSKQGYRQLQILSACHYVSILCRYKFV